MAKNLYIGIFLVAFVSGATAQNVLLSREKVAIRVDPVHVTVSGEYVFRNNAARVTNQTMFFPLPVIRGEQKLDSVSFYDLTGSSSVNYRRLPAGLFYQLTFQPQQSRKIGLYYSYDHNGTEARYLQKGHASYWNSPISQEDVTVSFNELEITIDSLSVKPETKVIEDGITKCSWHRTNFMPDKELEIWFHRD